MTRSPGRPAIGPKIEVRLPLAQIAWLDEQRGDASRAEEVRRLIDAAQRPGITRQQIRRAIAEAEADHAIEPGDFLTTATDAVWALLADSTTLEADQPTIDGELIAPAHIIRCLEMSPNGEPCVLIEDHTVAHASPENYQGGERERWPAGSTPAPEEER